MAFFRSLAPRIEIISGLAALLIGLACDPSQPEPEPTGECAVPEASVAGFELDLGGWASEADDLHVAASCTVLAGLPRLSLECVDGPDLRTVTLAVSGQLGPAIAVGDSVALEVRRKADAPADVGFWSVRGGEDELLLAGAHSFSSTPGADPQFFAPLTVDVDFTACKERKTDSCKLEQRLILEVGDAAGPTRVPHGASEVLPSGHRVVVERAMLMMASGDPKVCPLDESTPETYKFLISAT